MEEKGIVARDYLLLSAGRWGLGAARCRGGGGALRQRAAGLQWETIAHHINLKVQFNLDFRESKPTFLPPILSQPWTRINTQVLFANQHPPIPANYIPYPTRPAIN